MSTITEVSSFDTTVYEYDSTDPVQGKLGSSPGVANSPIQNLANRTRWLYNEFEALIAGTIVPLPPWIAPLNSPAFTGTATAPNVAAGDNSSKIANTNFVRTAVAGAVTIACSGSNVVLSQAQWGVAIIILTGALTANINLVFPAQTGEWLISNRTTGAFTITAMASGGGGLIAPQGYSIAVFGDGINLNPDDGLQALIAGTLRPAWIAPLGSPALTGTPTAPTQPIGDISRNLATDAFVENAVNVVAYVNCAGSNIVLVAAQYGCSILELGGALTANITIQFPAQTGQWIVGNYTTGNFTVTLIGAGTQSALVVQNTSTLVWSDSANIISVNGQYQNGSNGYGFWRIEPDGFITQWGTISTNGAGAATVTFPIPMTTTTYDIKLQTGDGPAVGDNANVGNSPLPGTLGFSVSSSAGGSSSPGGPVGIRWSVKGR